jgi:murein DD-endopeptidase MepM/ murein hydrolase activator NlpD
LGKKPLHIRNAVLEKSTAGEIASLDIAMADFALPKKESFDSEGYLGTKNISQSIFTKPVRYQTYTVKAGDTISGIAKRFNLSNISTLIAINDIKNVRSLRSGQKIRIPSVDGLTHIVKSGESLSGIADKYKTSLVTLLDVNDLTTELVKKGDVLFIPGATMDATALSEALGELFKDPLGVSWRMSSPYGYRPDPFTGVRSFHTGIDMVAPLGTSIKASMAGKVAAAGYNQVYGNYVIVSHSGGYQTLYAHMTTILVKLGQNVNQGSVLGKLGSTGYSTGPHLHFSVYKNGQLINPLSVLK